MGKQTILVVDDEDYICALMESLLLPVGYNVIKALNGREALDKIVEFQPDLVITDIMMPEIDGYGLATQLKNKPNTEFTPIIMVTGLGDRDSKIKGLEVGVDDFLTKPVDRVELIMRVRNLLKVKEYQNQLRQYSTILERRVEERTAQLKDAFEKLKRANAQVKDAHLQTIIRLAMAAEYKDKDTANHIQRMSHYTVSIAKGLGLPEKEIEIILYASPMHDIGKIGVPEYILLKPGKLTQEEYEIMKQHTIIGAKILEGSKSEFLEAGRVIAISHHEKYDGTGYPYGAKEENIPLYGRIVALADVFDALTSRRPYKPAFSNDQALQIIKESSGSHFDPMIVEAFFDKLKDILEIQKEYNQNQKEYYNGLLQQVIR